MKAPYVILLCLLLFSACVKDKPQSVVQPAVQLSNAKKVYVVNEGPFQPGENGAISLYDPTTGNVVENYYQTQNQSELGNVAQSMSYINGHYYIVVNNSGKIVVCNSQMKKTGEILNLTSPRYVLPITNQKAYVSDLYANAINIVDLNSNSKTGSIACAGWTEKMALIYNKVFVTNMRRNYIYVINTLTDAIVDSIAVGINAGDVVIDRHDKVWVLSSGDNSTGIAAKLTRINAYNNQVEAAFTFAAVAAPGNLNLSAGKDTLYFLNNGICRMAVSDNGLPAAPFVAAGSKNFYGFGIDPNDYSIYAADALDYSQRSNVYIYNANGTQLNVFKAGIIANSFYFE